VSTELFIPVSVFLITRNEEARIADAIDAILSWAGEVTKLWVC
jgi:hypothetical protein